MQLLKNIVVGLDVSKNSTNVLKRAFLLAKDKKAKLTILHVIDHNWIDIFFSNYEDVKNHAIKIIKEEISLIDTREVDYSILIEKGNPSDLVVKVAKENNTDLILIGADEQDNIESAVVSSTSRKIAQECNIPMLIVKTPCNDKYRNIVSFTDLSENSLDSINYAKSFFNFEKVKIVYAYKQIGGMALEFYNKTKNKEDIQKSIKQKESKKFQKFVEDNKLLDTEIIETYFNPSNGILKYVDSNKNDLVVLSSKGTNNLNSVIFGSTTSFLIENVKTDLLIYISKN